MRPTSREWAAMRLGLVLNLALIVAAFARDPSALNGNGWRAVAASAVVLLAYGAAGRWGIPATRRAEPVALRIGWWFGVVAGAVFLAQILTGYLAPIDGGRNAALGLLTFGTVFLLFIAAGFAGTLATGRFRAGLIAAVWTSVFGSLGWFVLILATYAAFRGTAAEARLLEADQVLADFRRSGMTDLRAFILQDYLGGGFFHLLLGPALATALGAAGSAVGAGVAWVRKRGSGGR